MENVKKLRKKASKSPLDKTVQDASELGAQQQRSRSREGEAQTSSVHKDGNGVITLSFSKEEVKQDSGQSTSGHGGVKKNGKKVGGANTKLPKINQKEPQQLQSKQTTAQTIEINKSSLEAQDPDVIDNIATSVQKSFTEDFDSNPTHSNKKQLRPRKPNEYKNLLTKSSNDHDQKIKISTDQLQNDLKEKLGESADQDFENQNHSSESESVYQDSEFGSKKKIQGKKKGTKKDTEFKVEEAAESSDSNELGQDEFDLEEFSESGGSKSKRQQKEEWKKLKKLRKVEKMKEDLENNQDEVENDYELDQQGNTNTVFVDNLPNKIEDINSMLRDVKKHIRDLEKQFFLEEDSEQEEKLKEMGQEDPGYNQAQVQQMTNIKQFWCIPLSVNVTQFDWDLLARAQKQNSDGRLFDIITIDPPWQLSSANPTRGVAIAYDTLNDNQILDMPFHKIQTDGFLFIWVINAKYRFALEIFNKNGYRMVDEIAWVKQTVNGKIAKGHGYYLQHAKETCLIGVKGNVKDKARFNIYSDVIFSQRRGQSQKPEEIYEIAEALIPNGYYIEIFGRRNNLHNGWVTVGNEI